MPGVAPSRREEHDHRAHDQLIEGVDHECRRGHHRIRQRHDQESRDSQRGEKRQRGEDPQGESPHGGRVSTDGCQIDWDHGSENALLGDEETAARCPQHVPRRLRADADHAEKRRRRAGDEAGERQHARTLEIERRGCREHEQECSRENDESTGWSQPQATRWAGRVGPARSRRPTIGETHPREHITDDRDGEHGRPHVDVQRVEPKRRRGRPAERADPRDIESENHSSAGGGPEHPLSPLHRVAENGPETERQGVGAAAGQRGVDRRCWRAEQTDRQRCLQLRERQHCMRLGPAQTENAKETEAPRQGPQGELTCRSSADRVRRHVGSPAR